MDPERFPRSTVHWGSSYLGFPWGVPSGSLLCPTLCQGSLRHVLEEDILGEKWTKKREIQGEAPEAGEPQ